MLHLNLKKFSFRNFTLFTALVLAILGFGLFSSQKFPVLAKENKIGKITLIKQFRPETKQASLVSRMLKEQKMNLTLILNLPDQAKLNTFIDELHNENSSNYHKWVSPQEFGKRFGLEEARYQSLVDWLKSEGFDVTHTWPNRLAIDFQGDVENVEKVFNVELNSYQFDGKEYFAPSYAPEIPAQFAEEILMVAGIENFSEPDPLVKMSTQTQIQQGQGSKGRSDNFTLNGRTAIAPKDFQAAYNTTPLITQGIDGKGQSIAIAARSDFNISDVQRFRTTFGLAVNDPEKIFPFGPVANRGGVEETEVLLDTQLSGSAAPSANVKVIIAPTITQSLQAIYNNFSSIPIVSLSFGLCEQRLTDSSTQAFNMLYAQGVAQGQTTFVASGDDGANDCRDGRLAVNGLASSPNVVAVGGTRLNPLFNSSGDATGYGGESVWNTGRGGGGGFSTVFQKPSFQIGAGVAKDNKRSIPDVALMADPIGPGYFIVQGGISTIIGGTSASAPSWAGIMTLAQQFNKGVRLGNANFRIYALGANQALGGPKVYNDVTTGDNSSGGVVGFSAQANYDLATGWGSVNATDFAINLFSQKNDFQPVRALEASLQGTDKVALKWQAPASTLAKTPALDLSNLESFSAVLTSDENKATGNLKYRYGVVRSLSQNSPEPLLAGQPPQISQLQVSLKGKNKANANFSVSDPDGDLGTNSGVSILLLGRDIKGVSSPRSGSLLLFGDKSVFKTPLNFTGQTSGTFPFTLKGLKSVPSAAIWASSIRDDAGFLSLAPKVTPIVGRVSGGAVPTIMNSNAAIFDKDDTVGVNIDGLDDDADTVGMTLGFLDGSNRVVFAIGIVGDSGVQNFAPFGLDIIRNPVKGQSKFNINFSISGLLKEVNAGTLKAVSVSLVDSNGNQSAVKVIPLAGIAQTNNLLRYNIYRSANAPVLLNPASLVAIVPATMTTFVDSLPTNGGTTFNYVVTAVYENGESVASNEVVIAVSK